jgi:hypothetical protein
MTSYKSNTLRLDFVGHLELSTLFFHTEILTGDLSRLQDQQCSYQL